MLRSANVHLIDVTTPLSTAVTTVSHSFVVARWRCQLVGHRRRFDNGLDVGDARYRRRDRSVATSRQFAGRWRRSAAVAVRGTAAAAGRRTAAERGLRSAVEQEFVRQTRGLNADLVAVLQRRLIEHRLKSRNSLSDSLLLTVFTYLFFACFFSKQR